MLPKNVANSLKGTEKAFKVHNCEAEGDQA